MKRYVNNDKLVEVQSGVLLILNSMVLTIFNFREKYTTDINGICMATITVTIPLIMNTYKDKLVVVKSHYDSLFKKIRMSFGGVVFICIAMLFEWLTDLITLWGGYNFVVEYLLLHTIQLYFSYLLLILGFSFVLEPWIYTLIFYLDKYID